MLVAILGLDRNFDTPEETGAFLDDNRLLIFLGAIAMGLAGLGLLVFWDGIRRLIIAEPELRSNVSHLVFGSGALGIGLLMLSWPFKVGIASEAGSALDFAAYQSLEDIHHWYLVYAQGLFALSTGILFFALHGAAAVPSWVKVTVGIGAATSLVYDAFTPLILIFPLWVIAFGFFLFKHPEPED